MKLKFLLVVLLVFGMIRIANATSITLYPGDYVYDETPPRGVEGDSAPGWGTGSWQGPATGKSNMHLMYNNELVDLFGAGHNLTVGDLEEISFWTKSTDYDWWVTIYTQFQGDGSDSGSWYDSRLHAYTGGITPDWTEWNTSDTGELLFHDSQRPSIGFHTLTDFATGSVGSPAHDYTDELILMITVQSNSGWDGFDGLIDGLTITTTKGVGEVDFEANAPVPEPSTILLFGFGLVGLVGIIRKKSE